MEEILTHEETYKYLKISKGTLYKLIKTQNIPFKKIGRQYRFIKSELNNYMKTSDNIQK